MVPPTPSKSLAASPKALPPIPPQVNQTPSTARARISTSAPTRNVARGIGISLAVGGATVLATPVLLSLVGFGAAGVGAGTLAAAIQSSIGNVAAGSLFALAQSIGAAGLAGSTVVAATGAFWNWNDATQFLFFDFAGVCISAAYLGVIEEARTGRKLRDGWKMMSLGPTRVLLDWITAHDYARGEGEDE
ncbi:hypothetical protein BT69DRAFT_1348843 [Atractiella rhizophila]|nr:hypothetical protein BT69DRAFT_1348843 [Atractiella rhizophila]